MSREFVRNIKNAVIKGESQEPLRTNIQNDLLSDGEDVAVRNGDEYHLLTDNIKEITSANSNIVIKRTGKNSVELVGRGGDGEGSPNVLIEVIENSKEYVELINPETNHFQIGLTGDFISNIENINQAIADIPEMPDMDNYYTKEEITTIIQGVEVDLSDYYNKEEIDQKLLEIETGDFEQVQSDWNETDDTKKSFIQNKPTIPDPVNLDDYYNKEEVDTKIDGIETGDFEQVQSDWEETDDTKKSFIQNKPDIPVTDDFVTKVLADSFGSLGVAKNINGTDLNDLLSSGFYIITSGATNSPYINRNGHVIVVGSNVNTNQITQIFIVNDLTPRNHEIHYRVKYGLNYQWTEWFELITTKNIQNFISGLEIEQEQSDWNETDEEKPSFIKNKPIIPEIPDLNELISLDIINKTIPLISLKIDEDENGDYLLSGTIRFKSSSTHEKINRIGLIIPGGVSNQGGSIYDNLLTNANISTGRILITDYKLSSGIKSHINQGFRSFGFVMMFPDFNNNITLPCGNIIQNINIPVYDIEGSIK